MVAQATAPAHPIASSLWHEPNDLTFIDADDRTNIVHYSAPSQSRPGDANIVALDILSGSTFCNCKASECGKGCWHQELVQAAWDGHPARILAARYSDAQLHASGKKASHMCAWARHRRFRVLPADALALVAARGEYKRRYRVAPDAAHAAHVAA